MTIDKTDGDILFSNFIIRKDGSVKSDHDIDSELWMSNGDSKTYRYTNINDVDGAFIVLAVFHGERLNRVSVSIDHRGQAWEGETPGQIKDDCRKLGRIASQLSSNLATTSLFSWGKIELFKDAKNSFMCSLVISYQATTD